MDFLTQISPDAAIGGSLAKPIVPRQLPANRLLERLRWTLSRLWSEDPALPNAAA